MKTQVIMKRKLWDSEISQQSKTEFLSATDLVRAGNQWRIKKGLPLFNFNEWLRTKGTKIFFNALQAKYGKVKINSKGKNQHTWLHPILFIDLALAISPEIKIQVYEWLYDSLLKYRNDSGDSYKKMTGALYNLTTNKSKFPKIIVDVAKKIKQEIGVENWEEANEKELEYRDKIHEYIAVYSDLVRDKDLVIKSAIKQAKEYMNNKSKEK